MSTTCFFFFQVENTRSSLTDQTTSESKVKVEQARTSTSSTSHQVDGGNVRSNSICVGLAHAAAAAVNANGTAVSKSNSTRMSVVKVTSMPNGSSGGGVTSSATTSSATPGPLQSMPGNYASKSNVDLRRGEDISLDKINESVGMNQLNKQAVSNKISCSRF